MTIQTQCELMSANEPQFDLTATPVPDNSASISGRYTLALFRNG